MEIGKKIMDLRKKNGLSQEELAEKVGVARQTISKWELGETSPNPEQLKLLSKELNISIDELLDNDIQSVLVEKVSNTEKLAGLVLKILKWLGIFFVVILVIDIISKIWHTVNVDLLIHIGDVSGGYYNFSANNVFRVNPDGEIVDTFKKLTFVFEEDEKKFFENVLKFQLNIYYF